MSPAGDGDIPPTCSLPGEETRRARRFFSALYYFKTFLISSIRPILLDHAGEVVGEARGDSIYSIQRVRLP